MRVEPVPPLDLKGKSEPVPAFRLIDRWRMPRGMEPRLDSPLVGREDELALLRDAFEQHRVRSARCRLVTVMGPAGIGKSRLAGTSWTTLRGAATVVAGRCLSYGEGLTFWPLREVVEELAGSPDDGERRRRRRPRSRGCFRRTPTPRPSSSAWPGRSGCRMPPASPAETFWAVRKLFEAAAAQAAARGPVRGHPLG